jgi:hypothetical protein
VNERRRDGRANDIDQCKCGMTESGIATERRSGQRKKSRAMDDRIAPREDRRREINDQLQGCKGHLQIDLWCSARRADCGHPQRRRARVWTCTNHELHNALRSRICATPRRDSSRVFECCMPSARQDIAKVMSMLRHCGTAELCRYFARRPRPQFVVVGGARSSSSSCSSR